MASRVEHDFLSGPSEVLRIDREKLVKHLLRVSELSHGQVADAQKDETLSVATVEFQASFQILDCDEMTAQILIKEASTSKGELV